MPGLALVVSQQRPLEVSLQQLLEVSLQQLPLVATLGASQAAGEPVPQPLNTCLVRWPSEPLSRTAKEDAALPESEGPNQSPLLQKAAAQARASAEAAPAQAAAEPAQVPAAAVAAPVALEGERRRNSTASARHPNPPLLQGPQA